MDRVKEYIDEGSSLLEEWKKRITRNRPSSNKPFDESKLIPGDTVSATPILGWVPFLYHSGIYVGNRQVVHIQKEGIVRCTLDEFQKDRTKVVIDPLQPFPHELKRPQLMDKRRELIVDTVESMVGEEWEFKAMTENCESFTNWVTTGRLYSHQGNVIRNTVCLTGASLIGFVIGRGRFRFRR